MTTLTETVPDRVKRLHGRGYCTCGKPWKHFAANHDLCSDCGHERSLHSGGCSWNSGVLKPGDRCCYTQTCDCRKSWHEVDAREGVTLTPKETDRG